MAQDSHRKSTNLRRLLMMTATTRQEAPTVPSTNRAMNHDSSTIPTTTWKLPQQSPQEEEAALQSIRPKQHFDFSSAVAAAAVLLDSFSLSSLVSGRKEEVAVLNSTKH